MSVPNIVEIAYARNISGTLQDIYDCARNMSQKISQQPVSFQLIITWMPNLKDVPMVMVLLLLFKVYIWGLACGRTDSH